MQTTQSVGEERCAGYESALSRPFDRKHDRPDAYPCVSILPFRPFMTPSTDTVPLDTMRELSAFTSESTGIPYHPLVRFAEPLFDAYEVESERAVALAEGDEDEAPDELLLVLETARLLWTAFGLPEAQARHAFADVQGLMMPGEHDEQDTAMLHLLLARLEERWHDLGAGDLSVDAAALPFGAVADRYRKLFPPQSDAPAVGASAEDLALFARPLLDAPEVAADLDLLDQRMELAQVLFDLARHHVPFDEQTRAVRDRFPDESDPETLVTDMNLHYVEYFS